MVFINCVIASIKKTWAPIDTKDWQSELKESLPPLLRSRQLFSSSLEEKDLPAYNLKKVIHTKAEGNSVTWNFWWDREYSFSINIMFSTQLISFWKQQTTVISQNCCCFEKLMRSWEWELTVFIRSFIWCTSHQLKYTKFKLSFHIFIPIY